VKTRSSITIAAKGARVLAAIATLSLLPVSSEIGAQVPKTTEYEYDALGRLTFVKDSQNGNRDYDYDSAGNRLNVAVGTANDAASEPASSNYSGPAPPVVPPPAQPTNLTKNYIADCAWRTSWTLSSGATSYNLRSTSGQNSAIYPANASGDPGVQVVGSTITVTTSCPTGDPQGKEPATVAACSMNGCSAAVPF
jgi:YD repeat-containing protein